MRRILVVIALTSTLACGEEPPDLNGDGAGDAEGTVTQIGLVHPQGTIAGHVYNAATGENLTGITVTIISGGAAPQEVESTDGVFRSGALPAGGSGHLIISSSNFITAQRNFSLPGAAGDFPTANAHAWVGEIGLLPKAPGELVVLGPDAAGVGSVTVGVDFGFAYLLDGNPAKSLRLTGTTDSQGVAGINGGMPDLNALSPLLQSMAGSVTVSLGASETTEGGSLSISYQNLGRRGTLPIVALRAGGVVATLANANQAQVLVSNAGDLVQRRQGVSVIEATDPIRILFDQAIDPDTLFTGLTTENDSGQVVLQEAEWSHGGTLLTLRPTVNLSEGQEYNLELSAAPLSDGPAAYSGGANLFTRPLSADLSVETVASWHDRDEDTNISEGDWIDLHLNQPVGARDGFGNSNLHNLVAEWAVDYDLNGDRESGTVRGEMGFEEGGRRVYETLILSEPNAGAGRSGFTTTLRVQLPAGTALRHGVPTTFFLIFNNPERVSGNHILRNTSGSPLSSTQVTVTNFQLAQ